jgi:hypothetical protein
MSGIVASRNGGSHVTHHRFLSRIGLVALLAIGAVQAQEGPAVEHAKRIVDRLAQDKVDEVASEFNAKVAAAMSASQLREVWSAVRQQTGKFTSFIDHRVTTPAPGITAVSLGCQFEKTAMNVIVAFDAENRIAGLRFAPRPAPSEPAPIPPTSNRFTEESVTVGAGEWALPGTLSMPVGRIAAAVVLVHGSGPHDRDETVGPNKPFRDLA